MLWAADSSSHYLARITGQLGISAACHAVQSTSHTHDIQAEAKREVQQQSTCKTQAVAMQYCAACLYTMPPNRIQKRRPAHLIAAVFRQQGAQSMVMQHQRTDHGCPVSFHERSSALNVALDQGDATVEQVHAFALAVHQGPRGIPTLTSPQG